MEIHMDRMLNRGGMGRTTWAQGEGQRGALKQVDFEMEGGVEAIIKGWWC